MRVIPIPQWMSDLFFDCDRRVIAPPDGDMLNQDVAPVDTLTGTIDMPSGARYPCYRMCAILEEGDLKALDDGGVVMLTILANRLPAFDIQVVPPDAVR